MSSEKDELVLEYEVNTTDSKLIKKEIIKSMPLILTGYIFMAIAIILIEILLILYNTIDGFTVKEIVWVICFPLINIFLAFILPWITSKNTKSDKLIPEPINSLPRVKVIFNKDGIKTDSELTTNNLKWFYFTKIIELEHFIYFRFSNFNNLNIPKRIFSDEQIKKLREMLTNYIDPKLTKMKLKEMKGEK